MFQMQTDHRTITVILAIIDIAITQIIPEVLVPEWSITGIIIIQMRLLTAAEVSIKIPALAQTPQELLLVPR